MLFCVKIITEVEKRTLSPTCIASYSETAMHSHSHGGIKWCSSADLNGSLEVNNTSVSLHF